ncbi:MATE family efflux transporter [Clostridioides difficile]
MNIYKKFNSVEDVRFIKVFKFIVPTYLTSLFTTLYTIVDGIFVSRYVGTNALAAINIVYPIVNILTGIALIFAVGGSSLVGISIGAKHIEKAKKEFSICIIWSLLIGAIISSIMLLGLNPILKALGATPSIMESCKIYALIWLISFPGVICKEVFTYFIRIDGSPSSSFIFSLSGGILNIILDYIFIGKMGMGIMGAGLATILGIFLTCALGIYYFWKKNNILKFTIKELPIRFLPKCILNGSAEFIDQIAVAITTVAFNRVALKFAGEDGVAAVSIIMYLQFIVLGIYFGYSMGISPLISYAYGNKKKDICKKLQKYSYILFLSMALVLYLITFIFAPFAVNFFAEPDSMVFNLAVSGMRLYGIGFIFSGLNIFTAIRFTAYGRGNISAIITSLRSFLLLLLFLLTLPIVLGVNGLWIAVPAAELITVFVTIFLIYRNEKRLWNNIKCSRPSFF